MFPDPYRVSGSATKIDFETGEDNGFCYDLFPGGVRREWKKGKATTWVVCQLCHPRWTGRDAPDPECEGCGGKGERLWPEKE